MQQTKIRVVIVDDHDMVRQTWKMLLELHPEIEIAGDCDNGEDAIAIVQADKPDIVLMDINMQPLNGFEVSERILKIMPAQKIIGISINNQTSYARNLLKIGAKGFVTKNSQLKEMVLAIKEVYEGKTYICEEVKKKMKIEEAK